MEPYKILERGANFKIKVFGKDIEEIFTNALFALNDVLNAEIKNVKEKEERFLSLSSFDNNLLLFDFLNKILEESYSTQKIFVVSRINVFNNFLEAQLVGIPVKSFKEKIKFVMHDKPKIEKRKNIFQAQVIFSLN